MSSYILQRWSEPPNQPAPPLMVAPPTSVSITEGLRGDPNLKTNFEVAMIGNTVYQWYEDNSQISATPREILIRVPHTPSEANKVTLIALLKDIVSKYPTITSIKRPDPTTVWPSLNAQQFFTFVTQTSVDIVDATCHTDTSLPIELRLVACSAPNTELAILTPTEVDGKQRITLPISETEITTGISDSLGISYTKLEDANNTSNTCEDNVSFQATHRARFYTGDTLLNPTVVDGISNTQGTHTYTIPEDIVEGTDSWGITYVDVPSLVELQPTVGVPKTKKVHKTRASKLIEVIRDDTGAVIPLTDHPTDNTKTQLVIPVGGTSSATDIRYCNGLTLDTKTLETGATYQALPFNKNIKLWNTVTFANDETVENYEVGITDVSKNIVITGNVSADFKYVTLPLALPLEWRNSCLLDTYEEHIVRVILQSDGDVEQTVSIVSGANVGFGSNGETVVTLSAGSYNGIDFTHSIAEFLWNPFNNSWTISKI